MDWTNFWATNKKIIDPAAPRYTAVDKQDTVTAKVTGEGASNHTEEKPKHIKNADLGLKTVAFGTEILLDQEDVKLMKVGEEITLMNWGNAIVTSIGTDSPITTMELKLHLEGDVKKTEKKVTWLATSQELIPVDMVDFDYLITKDKLEEDDNWEDFLTPQTEFRVPGLADVNVKQLKRDDIIQFERKGYYRCDRAWTEEAPAVFFCIPTGKDNKGK